MRYLKKYNESHNGVESCITTLMDDYELSKASYGTQFEYYSNYIDDVPESEELFELTTDFINELQASDRRLQSEGYTMYIRVWSDLQNQYRYIEHTSTKGDISVDVFKNLSQYTNPDNFRYFYKTANIMYQLKNGIGDKFAFDIILLKS